MTERKTDDAEVQRVVRSFSQESTIRDVTRDWSSADFEYALSRVERDASQLLDRDWLAALLSSLRTERKTDEAQREEERRHMEAIEIARQSLARSDNANRMAKWSLVIAVIALAAALAQMLLH